MSASRKVLVIGGGISGISAAVEVSEAGADVLLVEKNDILSPALSKLQGLEQAAPGETKDIFSFRGLGPVSNVP